MNKIEVAILLFVIIGMLVVLIFYYITFIKVTDKDLEHKDFCENNSGIFEIVGAFRTCYICEENICERYSVQDINGQLKLVKELK